MADAKLSALTELAVAPAVNDELYIRDVSEAPAAESKRITMANLLGSLPAHTLAGTVTINGQTFDAGAGDLKVTTSSIVRGLVLEGTHADHGPVMKINHTDTTPVQNNTLGGFDFNGYDGNVSPAALRYGQIRIYYENIGDGTEAGKFAINLANAGVPDNNALTLSGAGRLWVGKDIDFTTSVDSGAVVDHVSLGCFDVGGVRRLAISSEQTVTTEAAGASNRSFLVRINGASYKMLLIAV